MKNLYLILAILSSCSFIFPERSKNFSSYGNYCNIAKQNSNIPIDKTDLACKNYLKCSEENKDNLSICDQRMISDLNLNNKVKSKNELMMRLWLTEYFLIKRTQIPSQF